MSVMGMHDLDHTVCSSFSGSMKKERTDFGILDIDIQGTGKEGGGAAENFQ